MRLPFRLGQVDEQLADAVEGLTLRVDRLVELIERTNELLAGAGYSAREASPGTGRKAKGRTRSRRSFRRDQASVRTGLGQVLGRGIIGRLPRVSSESARHEQRRHLTRW